MSTELEVAGNLYTIGKLDAMKQFHVARRIAPVVAAMGLSITELMQAGKTTGDDSDLLAIAGPVAEVVSKMADEEVEYVLRTCLAVVRRKIDTGLKIAYMPVQTGTQLQFQDITMMHMIRLAVEVLKENLGGFFGTPTDGTQSAQLF